MTVVIPIRFRDNDLKKIDELVKSGVFKSRSEAVRSLSLDAAESKYADIATANVSEAVEAVLNALKENRGNLRVTLKGKIAELVAEGRQRL